MSCCTRKQFSVVLFQVFGGKKYRNWNGIFDPWLWLKDSVYICTIAVKCDLCVAFLLL